MSSVSLLTLNFAENIAFEKQATFRYLGTEMILLEHAVRKKTVADLCPAPLVFAMIGGKWKLSILQILIFNGTKRFGELRKSIPGITQTMLTRQLRDLENDGLVHREIFAEVPPRVEYSATDDAIGLMPAFKAMHQWWETRTATSTKQEARSSLALDC